MTPTQGRIVGTTPAVAQLTQSLHPGRQEALVSGLTGSRPSLSPEAAERKHSAWAGSLPPEGETVLVMRRYQEEAYHRLCARLDRQLSQRPDRLGDLYRRALAERKAERARQAAATSWEGRPLQLGKPYSVNGARFQRVLFPDGGLFDVCLRGRRCYCHGAQHRLPAGVYSHHSPNAWGDLSGVAETRAAVIKARAVELRRDQEARIPPNQAADSEAGSSHQGPTA